MRLRHAVGERNYHQNPVPEILALVVLHQPGANATGLADVHTWQTRFGQLAQQEVHADLLRLGRLDEFAKLAARNFDHANDARRDFGHAYAAQVTGGQEDLDGLGAGHSRMNFSFYVFLSHRAYFMRKPIL